MPEGRQEIELTRRQLEQLLRDAAICAANVAVNVPASKARLYNAAWRLLDTLKVVKRSRKKARR